MSNEWIYDKVNALVKKYQTRNPEELAEALNIKILSLGDTEATLGMYKVILRNRFIMIASNVGYFRDMVFAHEIGHDQMHRDACKEGASFHENRLFNPITQYEIESNIFAAHLLIPDEEIYRLMEGAISEQELILERKVDIHLLNLKISELAKMNKLKGDGVHFERPDSQFLKQYKPEEDQFL